MSDSKSHAKRSLVKAEAVLRAQWPEVLQYMGDRPQPLPTSLPFTAYFSPTATLDEASGKALAVPIPEPSVPEP